MARCARCGSQFEPPLGWSSVICANCIESGGRISAPREVAPKPTSRRTRVIRIAVLGTVLLLLLVSVAVTSKSTAYEAWDSSNELCTNFLSALSSRNWDGACRLMRDGPGCPSNFDKIASRAEGNLMRIREYHPAKGGFWWNGGVLDWHFSAEDPGLNDLATRSRSRSAPVVWGVNAKDLLGTETGNHVAAVSAYLVLEDGSVVPARFTLSKRRNTRAWELVGFRIGSEAND